MTLLAVLLTRKAPQSTQLRFEIPIPGDPVTGSPALSISPDGKQVAFMAMGSKGKPIVWTRAMDAIAPLPVVGSEDARYPFWSADSRFLAFQVGDKLKTIEIANGGQRTICTIRGILNGAWNADGVIVAGTGSGPLLRIPLDGGPFVPVTTLDTANGQRSHWWPSFLPDNRHFLYTVNASTLKKSGVFVGSLDSADVKELVPGVITNAAYVAPGYLLYSREGNLFARPFEAKRLTVTGDEFPVVEKLRAYYGYTAFSASQTGTLIFRAGDQSRYQLAWFSRAGKPLGPLEEAPRRNGRKGFCPWRHPCLPTAPNWPPCNTSHRTAPMAFGSVH